LSSGAAGAAGPAAVGRDALAGPEGATRRPRAHYYSLIHVVAQEGALSSAAGRMDMGKQAHCTLIPRRGTGGRVCAAAAKLLTQGGSRALTH